MLAAAAPASSKDSHSMLLYIFSVSNGSIITCLVLSTKVVSLIPLSASLSFQLEGIRTISIKLGVYSFLKQRLGLVLYKGKEMGKAGISGIEIHRKVYIILF